MLKMKKTTQSHQIQHFDFACGAAAVDVVVVAAEQTEIVQILLLEPELQQIGQQIVDWKQKDCFLHSLDLCLDYYCYYY